MTTHDNPFDAKFDAAVEAAHFLAVLAKQVTQGGAPAYGDVLLSAAETCFDFIQNNLHDEGELSAVWKLLKECETDAATHRQEALLRDGWATKTREAFEAAFGSEIARFNMAVQDISDDLKRRMQGGHD